MCSQTSPQRRGFTLVEVLIVVGIIGVLALISWPVVAGARAQARMAHDTSSLRQIGQAMVLYLSDHRNRLPHTPTRNGSLQPGATETLPSGQRQRVPIYESIDRYFPPVAGSANSTTRYAHRSVWFSRNAQPVRRGRTVGTDSPTAINRNYPFGNYAHFGFNPFIWSREASGTGRDRGPWRADMNRVPNPSFTVLMAETNNRFGLGHQDLDPSRPAAQASDQGTLYRTSQPGGRGLYLFADFSVRALTGDQGLSNRPEIWKWW